MAPEAAAGGPIGLLRDGDIIEIDINNNAVNAKVSEEEFAERRKTWKPRVNQVDGYLARYRELVTGAPQGAVLSAEGLKKD